MQMLTTWLVTFQAIRLDGGRCFKGVHLSQVHQPRNIDVALAWLVQLMLRWCTSCSGKRQSRAETSAPPKNNSCLVWGVSKLN